MVKRLMWGHFPLPVRMELEISSQDWRFPCYSYDVCTLPDTEEAG
jgi:hypothetical protein